MSCLLFQADDNSAAARFISGRHRRPDSDEARSVDSRAFLKCIFSQCWRGFWHDAAHRWRETGRRHIKTVNNILEFFSGATSVPSEQSRRELA